MTLMIVDDSNLIRSSVRNAASDLPLELVGMAADGVEALSLFASLKPDIVTLDVTMPRMDGLACLEEMLRQRPQTQVLVVTALKDEATGLKALALGAAGILPKPFTRDKLRSELLELLEGGGS